MVCKRVCVLVSVCPLFIACVYLFFTVYLHYLLIAVYWSITDWPVRWLPLALQQPLLPPPNLTTTALHRCPHQHFLSLYSIFFFLPFSTSICTTTTSAGQYWFSHLVCCTFACLLARARWSLCKVFFLLQNQVRQTNEQTTTTTTTNTGFSASLFSVAG